MKYFVELVLKLSIETRRYLMSRYCLGETDPSGQTDLAGIYLKNLLTVHILIPELKSWCGDYINIQGCVKLFMLNFSAKSLSLIHI